MILYEDNHIIVAIKPQNMPVCKDASCDEDFLNVIKSYVKEKYNKPGEAFIGLIQRLDRPTGGVMVFARTSKAAKRLCEQIKSKDFNKEYLAITDRSIASKATLHNYLLKDCITNTSKVVNKDTQNSKEAVLNYEVIKSKPPYSLLNIELITGRHHQIRVQLAYKDAMVVGDKKYKGTPNQKLCLWAHSVNFVHPTTKEKLAFSAPPPDFFPWSVFYEN